MKKVFLYLYPIKEYTEMFLYDDDSLYDEWNVKRPLPILNECIQKRYRDNGYQVVFALYPDKSTFGVDISEEDKIIYADVLFQEASGVDENKNIKKDFIPRYPNEQLLLKQLGEIDKLVVGGYHAQDCVKRVAETAIDMGIDTLIDIELTDLFFGLYKEDYFNTSEYDPIKYKQHVYSYAEQVGETFIDKHFKETYSSTAYGFNTNDSTGKKI